MKNETIEIITRQYGAESSQVQQLQTKGEKNSSSNKVVAMVVSSVSVEALAKSLYSISSKIDEIAEDGQSNSNKFSLEEIEVNAEISANGSIQLIGAVEAGITGGIKLTFKRNKDA